MLLSIANGADGSPMANFPCHTHVVDTIPRRHFRSGKVPHAQSGSTDQKHKNEAHIHNRNPEGRRLSTFIMN
jgi:hypothetical protein